jgi:hypothetical protein
MLALFLAGAGFGALAYRIAVIALSLLQTNFLESYPILRNRRFNETP